MDEPFLSLTLPAAPCPSFFLLVRTSMSEPWSRLYSVITSGSARGGGEQCTWSPDGYSRVCGQGKPTHRGPSGAQQSTYVNNFVHIFLDIKEITGFIEPKF